MKTAHAAMPPTPQYAWPLLRDHSFRERKVVEAPVKTVIADGMACRIADAQALKILLAQADDVIADSDAKIAHAMRVLFCETHNVAEGNGAAGLAAAIQQQRWQGRSVAGALSGGNVDSEVFARVLASG